MALLSWLNPCQASEYAALAFFGVSELSAAFVLHGTPSCLLIAHQLAEICLLFLCDFFPKHLSKRKRTKFLVSERRRLTTSILHIIFHRSAALPHAGGVIPQIEPTGAATVEYKQVTEARSMKCISRNCPQMVEINVTACQAAAHWLIAMLCGSL